MSKAIYKKLLEIQKRVTALSKDKETKEYSYISSEKVIDEIRPMFNEYGLLLLPQTTGRSVRADETKSGTTRYFTEIDITFTWVDVDTGETLTQTFTAQGVDLAGEKGIGKALTYGEKYYLLKVFHVPTPKDDPDADGTTKSGEKRQRGTQAAAEAADHQRKVVRQLVDWFSKGEEEKKSVVVQTFTKNDKANYAGVSAVDDIAANVLPVVYAKMTNEYKKRTGNDFKLTEDAAE